MNLSTAIIVNRKGFCDECKFLASVQIRSETKALLTPINLCRLHLEEFIEKLQKCLDHIKYA